jgi:hypothetical protein
VRYSRRCRRRKYPEPEFEADYCEQEPEVPNAEPALPEDLEDGKFNLTL